MVSENINTYSSRERGGNEYRKKTRGETAILTSFFCMEQLESTEHH